MKTTVGRVISRVHMVEKGMKKQGISKLAILRKDGQDYYSGSGSVRNDQDGETQDSGQRGFPVGSPPTHLRGQPVRGSLYACRLQHSEGVETAVGVQQMNIHDPHHTPVLESTSPQSPVVTTPGATSYSPCHSTSANFIAARPFGTRGSDHAALSENGKHYRAALEG